MKLLTKTSFYFFGVSLIIFCLGGIFFYYLFEVIIDKDINRKLLERKEYSLAMLERTDSILLFQKFSGHLLEIKRIVNFKETNEGISDTIIYDDIKGKPIRFRQLAFNVRVNDSSYRIHIRRVLVEQQDLIEGVVALEVILFAAFVIILTLMNNRLSRQLWRPFHYILDVIRNYQVDRAESLSLPRNNITEFSALSSAIEKMSAKINHEFNVQREFMENASHEVQTPLAIIKNKLEILMQSPELTQEQISFINSAVVATNRLSKLNETLIVLSKIENRQFHEVNSMDLAEVIDRLIKGLEELIILKSIKIERLYIAPCIVTMHRYLCEMMLENLIINSIKHNASPGRIIIQTEKGQLTISNTGEPLSVDPAKLFQRFVKSNQKSQSLGLGLSIVKAVCDTYQFSVRYSFAQGLHTISVTFTGKQ
jgi:signal transduction histidine kinase